MLMYRSPDPPLTPCQTVPHPWPQTKPGLAVLWHSIPSLELGPHRQSTWIKDTTRSCSSSVFACHISPVNHFDLPIEVMRSSFWAVAKHHKSYNHHVHMLIWKHDCLSAQTDALHQQRRLKANGCVKIADSYGLKVMDDCQLTVAIGHGKIWRG